MKKKKTISQNYLDFIPIRCKDFNSITKEINTENNITEEINTENNTTKEVNTGNNITKEINTEKTELVTVLVENKGFFHCLAQKLLHKPPISQIHLDKMGSFLWLHMDGNNTIYEIAQLVKEQFGEDAEPLYNRLLQYIRTLEDYGFIKVKKPNIK